MEAYTRILSIIVPCYNEEESVPHFYAETVKQETFFHEKDVEFEFIFVDDGSRDGTVAAVKALREKDERVHLVSFSRNFGKEAAIIAGLEKSVGDFTVLMDADLQDPPAILPEMYSYIEQGYDGDATCGQKGRAADQVVLCPEVLWSDAKDFQDGDCGWREGLPADDKTGDRCDSGNEGVQSLFKGNFWMGWLSHEVD